MWINDLPKEAQEELRKILREEILEAYHSGELPKQLGEEVEEGLSDEEILARYDNAGCWNPQIIEEYIMQWKARNK